MEFIKEQKKKSIFKVYLIYFICMVCFLFVRIAYTEGWLFADIADDNVLDMIFTIITQIGIMFLLPMTLYCLFIKVSPKSVFKTCNYSTPNISVILISLAIGVFAYILNIALSTMFSGIISILGYQTNTGVTSVATEYTYLTFALQMISVGLLPALCEEFLHRGILLQGTKHAGFKSSIIISGVLFGLMHFNINQVFYATILGCLIGLISVAAKNIWPAIIVHFVNNGISVYLDLAQSKKLFGSNFYNIINDFFENTNFILAFVIIFVILIISSIVLAFLIYLLYKYGMLKKVQKIVDKNYESTNPEVKNMPIMFRKGTKLNRIVESTTTLNLDIESMKSPIDFVLPKQNKIYKQTIKDRIFLVGAIVLGLTVTIFTFVWGLYW